MFGIYDANSLRLLLLKRTEDHKVNDIAFAPIPSFLARTRNLIFGPVESQIRPHLMFLKNVQHVVHCGRSSLMFRRMYVNELAYARTVLPTNPFFCSFVFKFVMSSQYTYIPYAILTWPSVIPIIHKINY